MKFLTQHKQYALAVAIALFALVVLSATVIIYETERRDIISANDYMAYLHHNEVYSLTQEILLREQAIEEIADRKNILHTELFASQEETRYASRNQQSTADSLYELQQRFDELLFRFNYERQQHGDLNHFRWVEWHLRLNEMDASMVIHADADPEKIDMIVRHFNAKYTGDLEAYLATVHRGYTWEYPGIAFGDYDTDNWDWEWSWIDWMLLNFRSVSEREYYRMEVKFIPGAVLGSSGSIQVLVLVQATPDSRPFLREYTIAITSIGGENFDEWRIYDYH